MDRNFEVVYQSGYSKSSKMSIVLYAHQKATREMSSKIFIVMIRIYKTHNITLDLVKKLQKKNKINKDSLALYINIIGLI